MNKGFKVAGLAVAGVVALTTKSGGKKKTFEVFSSVYFDCGMYSYYPTCVKSAKPVSTPTKNGGVNGTPKSKKTSGTKSDSNKKSGGFKSGGFSSSKKR